MAQKTFTLEFDFSSTHADRDGYSRRVMVKAKNHQEALNLARHVGWERFGARFTENCYDWRVVTETARE